MSCHQEQRGACLPTPRNAHLPCDEYEWRASTFQLDGLHAGVGSARLVGRGYNFELHSRLDLEPFSLRHCTGMRRLICAGEFRCHIYLPSCIVARQLGMLGHVGHGVIGHQTIYFCLRLMLGGPGGHWIVSHRGQHPVHGNPLFWFIIAGPPRGRAGGRGERRRTPRRAEADVGQRMVVKRHQELRSRRIRR